MSNVEGRGYKSSHNDMRRMYTSHLLKANVEDLNEFGISRENDALEETLSTHVTMDIIFVSLIIDA